MIERRIRCDWCSKLFRERPWSEGWWALRRDEMGYQYPQLTLAPLCSTENVTNDDHFHACSIAHAWKIARLWLADRQREIREELARLRARGVAASVVPGIHAAALGPNQPELPEVQR